jgi:hypothetical protein
MEKPNKSIECTVEQCRYHCGDCNYCSLPKVHISAHEQYPTTEEYVDCRSFSLK